MPLERKKLVMMEKDCYFWTKHCITNCLILETTNIFFFRWKEILKRRYKSTYYNVRTPKWQPFNVFRHIFIQQVRIDQGLCLRCQVLWTWLGTGAFHQIHRFACICFCWLIWGFVRVLALYPNPAPSLLKNPRLRVAWSREDTVTTAPPHYQPNIYLCTGPIFFPKAFLTNSAQLEPDSELHNSLTVCLTQFSTSLHSDL